MSDTEPRPRRVALMKLAELCGDDADALYWVSQQHPDSIESAREFLRNWNEQIRPWLHQFEKQFRGGDKKAVFRVVAIAASFEAFPVPGWASKAVYRGWHAYTNWKPGAESINAAMGVERAGKKHAENRRAAFLRPLSYWLVNHHAFVGKRKIGKPLYRDVAAQLLDPSKIREPYLRIEVESMLGKLQEEFDEPLKKLSGGTVEKYYGEFKRKLDDLAIPEKLKPRYHLIFDNPRR